MKERVREKPKAEQAKQLMLSLLSRVVSISQEVVAPFAKKPNVGREPVNTRW